MVSIVWLIHTDHVNNINLNVENKLNLLLDL